MIAIYAFLGLCLAFRSQALTYYLDPTCSGKVTDAVLTEVKSMASEGSSRLKNNNDQVMAAAFKQIFMVDKTNTNAYNKVTSTFDTIAGMTSTDWKSSDVRIYCDNDDYGVGKRWQLVPDLPNASKKSKNSKKPFDQQHYWDAGNQIFRKPGSKGCQDDDVTLAQTYKFKDNPDKATDQNPGRETITMCNYAFNQGDPGLLSNIDAKKDIPKTTIIDDFDYLISMTLFHELCHLTKAANAPGSAGDEANGWGEVAELSADVALDSADSYAFLGLSAILNKRNVRIAADTTKAIAGDLEFITPPTPPATGSKRRGLKFVS